VKGFPGAAGWVGAVKSATPGLASFRYKPLMQLNYGEKTGRVWQRKGIFMAKMRQGLI
jgi:hypothetical protein